MATEGETQDPNSIDPAKDRVWITLGMLVSEEEAMTQLLANHPGLTHEKAEAMARWLGW